MKSISDYAFPALIVAGLSLGMMVHAADPELPDAKPVPDMQVLPEPYDQASFQLRGKELTRYHFGPDLRHPFWYPIIGPGGRSLTRMGMPHDPARSRTPDEQPKDPNKPGNPHGHSHQTSVWITYKNVNDIDFWRDSGAISGQIVHMTDRDGLEYNEENNTATLLTRNAWKGPDGSVLMYDRRMSTVYEGENDSWWMIIDLQFEAPKDKPTTLGKTPFGPIGVRLSKTIDVKDGGGRILNSEGNRNEKGIHWKKAKWVDYSGPVTQEEAGGITLMNHPQNPKHPAEFHVRDNGWMGITLTRDAPRVIEPGKPLRLRFALWVHPGAPDLATIESQWESFARSKFAELKVKHPHH